MDRDLDQRAHARALGVLCALILCVLLTAGLWPFCAPKNAVEWIQGGNGLRFGRHGIAASAEDFRAASPDGPCSLEIWSEPERVDGGGTILAFDSSADPKFPFALKQLGASLAIQRFVIDRHGKAIRPWLRTDRVFEKGKRVLLTITGGRDETVVYVNGVPAKVSEDFGLESGDLTGRLVLGDSTVGDSWAGQIAGLAVYDSALSPLEVKTHLDRWERGEEPSVPGEKPPLAPYRFDENGGRTVDDRVGGGHDLVIPPRYFVLHPPFLESPLGPFRDRWAGWRSWSYWFDVCLNVAGFVPLGFFFTAYFSLARPIRQPRATALLFGLVVSLGIEIAQYFLPTRFRSERRHHQYVRNRNRRGAVPAGFHAAIVGAEPYDFKWASSFLISAAAG